MLARHLYGLGASYLKPGNDLYLFSAVNLLQDSVEAFLLAVADHVGVALDEKVHFDKYFVQINARIAPAELPFKNQLLRLNRIRIDSKHHGIQPARDECDRLGVSVREFFEGVSNLVLRANFSTISTVDLLRDGEAKQVLLEAKRELENGNFSECSICCRKALYVELEHWYDVGVFREGAKPKGLRGQYSRAPFYALNKEYISERVRDPTDYIVIHHSDLEHELLKYGVDNTAYWNVWRLTPEVYRDDNREWIVKRVFEKLDNEVLREQIEYIFNTTVDVVFTIHSKRASTKSSSYGRYYIELKAEEVSVFEKADRASRVTGKVPRGLTRIDTDFSVRGLKGDGTYWHVRHTENDFWLYGYIHGENVKDG